MYGRLEACHHAVHLLAVVLDHISTFEDKRNILPQAVDNATFGGTNTVIHLKNLLIDDALF